MKPNSLHRLGRTAILSLIFLLLAQGASAIPSFPGAEGHGAVATGGRGGTVIMVSNLNATGAGSLYQALKTPGDRIIIFNVSGTINLVGLAENGCYTSSPCIAVNATFGNVTILGQSAPGYGIVIKGGIAFKESNVIVRYITIRPGYNVGQTGLRVSYGHDIIFDHVSVSWVSDDMIDIYQYGTPSDRPGGNTTVSYSLIAEGFCDSPTDMTNCWSSPLVAIGTNVGGASHLAQNWSGFDYHHNLVAHVQDRMPLLKNAEATVINNIFYNGEYAMSYLRGGGHFDFVNNSFNRPLPYNLREIAIYNNSGGEEGINGTPSLYVSGNIDFNGTIPTQWNIVGQGYGSGGQTFPATAGWQRFTPNSNPTYPITAVPATELNTTVLSVVGNSRYIASNGSWIDRNDTVDKRIISNYTAGTGDVKRNQSQYGGYTLYYNTTPYTDSDFDGISDEWEIAKGLNANDNSDSNNIAPNGYMYLENYLSGEEPLNSSSNTWTIGSGGDAWSSASSGDNTVQNKGSGHINVGQLADDYSDNNQDLSLFGFSAGDVTVSGGVLQIANGSASTNTHRAHYTDLNITNSSIYYSGRITAGEYIGNIFRLNDAGNWYSNFYDINDTTPTKSHYRVYAPQQTFGTDSDTSTDMVVGTQYALKQKACGATFTNYINGALEDTETNTTLTGGGYVGYTFSNSGGVGTIQVDDIRVLPLDAGCNEVTYGNLTTWHNWTNGNVTNQIGVNATTPANTNYSVYYRLNNTGDFILLASNQTGNQTISISTKYQNTDVRLQLSGNETATPEVISITYYSQVEETVPQVCGNLNTSSTYTMTQNVSSEGTCFTIGANNITLDGYGYTISFSNTSTGSGINNSGYDNVTIKNVTIVQANTTFGGTTGIYYLSGADNGFIQNVSVNVNNSGNSSYGTYLVSSNNILIKDGTFVSNKSIGVWLQSSSNNTVTNNTVVSNNSIGLYLSGWSNNNTFTFNNATSSTNYGMSIFNSSSNNLTLNNVTSITNGGLSLTKSSSNKVVSNTFSTDSITSTEADVRVDTDTNRTNVFIDNNFTKPRKIEFGNVSTAEFNQSQDSGISFISTNTSAIVVTNRSILLWTQANITLSETFTGTARANYSAVGLLPSTNYQIWNGTNNDYSLTTDSAGILPDFTINFTTSITTVKILQAVSAGVAEYSKVEFIWWD